MDAVQAINRYAEGGQVGTNRGKCCALDLQTKTKDEQRVKDSINDGDCQGRVCGAAGIANGAQRKIAANGASKEWESGDEDQNISPPLLEGWAISAEQTEDLIYEDGHGKAQKGRGDQRDDQGARGIVASDL